MALKAELRVSQKQRLSLTQSMRTSLRILRLSGEDLIEELAAYAAENPFIEFRRHAPHQSFDPGRDATASVVSLFQSVAQQIATLRLDEETRNAALFLAGELREDGYLDDTLEEIGAASGVSVAILARGLTALQRCDPPGVGARNLKECLAIQLADRGIPRARADQAVQHALLFRGQRWKKLAQTLGCSEADVAEIAALLPSLTPVPLAASPVIARTLIADLIAETATDGRIRIALNPDAQPRFALSPQTNDVPLSGELARLVRHARDLLSALSAREGTLTRIAMMIADVQRAFFRDADCPIVPMSRKDAAQDLGLHPSTLGRAIRDKSILIAGKTYPLSQFFQPAIVASDGVVSPYDVQRRLRMLVQSEDPGAPLADEDIRTQLRNEGVDIARRTVAKYRKCMRIPSSLERRRQRGRRHP